MARMRPCSPRLSMQRSLWHQLSSFNTPHRSYSSTLKRDHSDWFKYSCIVETEPPYYYKPGGLHPVHLGDVYNHRYKILDKLGHGSSSTVWAVRDYQEQKSRALKIIKAARGIAGEGHILRTLRDSRADSAYQYLPEIFDEFVLQGPNGTHQCIVLEIVGGCIQDLYRTGHYRRPPALYAKRFAQEALLALQCLHDKDITHGGESTDLIQRTLSSTDIHTRNLALAADVPQAASVHDFMLKLNAPAVGLVVRKDGGELDEHVPRYLVRDKTYPVDLTTGTAHIKLIDFGNAFHQDQSPSTLQVPRYLAPPEVFFDDKLSLQVDLWSMGMTVRTQLGSRSHADRLQQIWELITANPPFGAWPFKIDDAMLVTQMLELTRQGLPARWMPAFNKLLRESEPIPDTPDPPLEEAIHNHYSGEHCQAEFTRAEIADAGQLIKRMLRLEPKERASAREIMASTWLQSGGHDTECACDRRDGPST